ncbi:unnamed protein product [Ixodes pacificus]
MFCRCKRLVGAFINREDRTCRRVFYQDPRSLFSQTCHLFFFFFFSMWQLRQEVSDVAQCIQRALHGCPNRVETGSKGYLLLQLSSSCNVE